MSKRKRGKRPTGRHKGQPGLPPGTLHTEPDTPPSALQAIAYSPTDYVEHPSATIDTIRALLHEWPVVWVNVVSLGSADTLRAVGDLFHIHPLALEDVVHVHQRPKVEPYPEHQFIVLRMVRDDRRGETEQVSAWVGKRAVVTFQEDPGDSFDPVRDRIRRGTGRVRESGADYLAYALVDALLDRFFPLLEGYAAELEELEDAIANSTPGHHVRRVHELKRDILALRRTIWPIRDAIGSLLREPDITPEVRHYWRDCQDHSLQLIEILQACRDLATGAVETYMSNATNRMNEVMKVLTMIATIFIPLSFVTGIYGMNFDDIPGLHSHWGFGVAILAMLGIAIGMLTFFFRRGWLGSRDGED